MDGSDGVNGCLACGAVFGRWAAAKRDTTDPHYCEQCGERRRRAAEAAERAAARQAAARERAAHRQAEEREAADLDKWAAVRLDYLPETTDTETELRAAAGEGPGPDDAPGLPCAFWDSDGSERLARVRLYAGDVDHGRPIRFVPRGRVLSGPGATLDARGGPRVGRGRDRLPAGGRRNAGPV